MLTLQETLEGLGYTGPEYLVRVLPMAKPWVEVRVPWTELQLCHGRKAGERPIVTWMERGFSQFGHILDAA